MPLGYNTADRTFLPVASYDEGIQASKHVRGYYDNYF